jgi:G3E family GTPase
MPEKGQKIPITILSGFLGTGKTTLLKRILENSEGVRIGVVVNDVAEVNIDAKLVINNAEQGFCGGKSSDVVELSNGCACCSAGDDFFGALADLVIRASVRNAGYDHIVFEASGVSEPRLLRAMFLEAAQWGIKIMDAMSLESMVTVVDASNFLDLYASMDVVKDREDLIGERNAAVHAQMEKMQQEDQIQTPAPTVVQLLIEQIETADVIVLNKIDMVDESGLKYLSDTLEFLNPVAEIFQTTFGKVPVTSLLVEHREGGVASLNDMSDHQTSVEFARWLESQGEDRWRWKTPAVVPTPQASTYRWTREAIKEMDNDVLELFDSPAAGSILTEEAKQSLIEEYGFSLEELLEDGYVEREALPQGTPTSRDRQDTTATKRFGITTFVYSQRRPFVTERLDVLMQGLPWIRLAQNAQTGDVTKEKLGDENKKGPFSNVLRSKGFVWKSTDSIAAYHWSQAGRQIELGAMGKWWAAVDRAQWPEEGVTSILADCSGEWGDRRQELVFIGANMDKNAITKALDACLATDEEIQEIARFEQERPKRLVARW